MGQRILALDIAGKTGWALFDTSKGETPREQLVASGVLTISKGIFEFQGPYPYNVRAASTEVALKAIDKAKELKPDVIVIENTNLGKSRTHQRFLEWAHLVFVDIVETDFPLNAMPKVIYLSSSTWRHALGLKASKGDAKNNRIAKKIRELSDPEMRKKLRQQTGVKGRVGKKHLAIRMVNDVYGFQLKMKDDDIADAICLGQAYLSGAVADDGA